MQRHSGPPAPLSLSQFVPNVLWLVRGKVAREQDEVGVDRSRQVKWGSPLLRDKAYGSIPGVRCFPAHLPVAFFFKKKSALSRISSQ